MKKTLKQRDEMARILSNPDNLIVSESLVGRLDFGEEETAPEISTKLTVGESVVSGRFRNYKVSCEKEPEQELKISFVCQEDQLEKLLNIKPATKCKVEIMENKIEGGLMGISISSRHAELVITVVLTRYI